jgi:uncharacterized delta-60 repeat protein
MKFLQLFLLLLTAFITTPLRAAPGDLDSLNPALVGTQISALATQPDGKIIIGGSFSSVLGQPRANIARLNADGTLDTGFDPKANSVVRSVVIQPDGKILIAGQFTNLQPNGAAAATARSRIARLNADGTLDPDFDPKANSTIFSALLQPNGQILISGNFTTLQPNGAASPTTRNYIARLEANGSLVSNFNPNPNASVRGLALQPDGKILLCGTFINLQPNASGPITSRNFAARVNDDGTLDTGFDPNISGSSAEAMTVQPDGKILIGGNFSTVGGTASQHLARVDANGVLDSDFDPKPNGRVYGLALQTDGKILVAGQFTTFQPNGDALTTPRNRVARLNGDGTLDPAFDPNADNDAFGVSLQADGKILLGGEFTTLQPNNAGAATPRSLFGRLENDATTSALTTTSASRVLWSRSGSGPELSRVTFEFSTNNGVSWSPLGNGSRVGSTADWEFAGLSLQTSGTLRARGWIPGGLYCGSASVIEQIQSISSPAEDFTYTSDGTSLTITGYTGSGGAVVIPANIGGVPVSALGTNCFSYRFTVTSITIPNGVVTVGYNAFHYCTSLTIVEIPASVTSISSTAFRSCSALTGITVASGNTAFSSLDGVLFNKPHTLLIQYPEGRAGTYTIPASVTTIGNNAFASSVLTGVTIPSSVTAIGSNAFSGSNLTGVTIPSSVTTIGSGAFSVCNSLTSVTIPSGVTGISDFAFQGCQGLSNVTISEGVTSIGEWAFSFNPSLTSVTIPPSVMFIGNSAFRGCAGLITTTFSGNAPTLSGDYTNPLEFPGGAIRVFKDAAAGFAVYYYSGNTGFTSPTWQGYPTVQLANPFAPEIVVEIPANTNFNDGDTLDFGAVDAGASKSFTVIVRNTGSGSGVLNGLSLSKSGSGAAQFSNTPLPVTTLLPGGSLSFSITFTPSATVGVKTAVISIASNDADENPFEVNLTGTGNGTLSPTITTPGDVGLISNGFVAGGLNLGTVTLGFAPAPGAQVMVVNNTGPGAVVGTFTGLPEGARVSAVVGELIYDFQISYVGGDGNDVVISNVTAQAADFIYTTSGGSAAIITGYAGSGGTVNIPSFISGLPVIAIGHLAFAGKSSVASVAIPSSVTSIGNGAFANCTGLMNVTIPSSVTGLGASAFRDCSGLASVQFEGNAPDLTYGLGHPSDFPGGPISVFIGTPTGFTVYFYEGATGFATPTWNGYPSVALPITSPEIVVEMPSGTDFTSGSTHDFGSRLLGDPGSRSFTVRNDGTGVLNGLLVSGTSGDFTSGQPGVSTLAPGESTTFDVIFTPTATGVRTASLQIASNDADENPFEVNLTGTGEATVTPVFNAPGDVIHTSSGFNAGIFNLGPITLGFTPTPGTQLMVVNNTGAGAVLGTFTGLPEGAILSADFGGSTYYFQISYVGGDGNDIVLTAHAPPTTAEFRFGTSANGGFAIENTGTLAIQSVTITLPDTTFFDSTSNPPGTAASAFSIAGTQGSVAVTLPDNAATDGQRMAVVNFVGFDPGEAVRIGCDYDRYADPDGNGEPAGTVLLVEFSDGSVYSDTVAEVSPSVVILGQSWAFASIGTLVGVGGAVSVEHPTGNPLVDGADTLDFGSTPLGNTGSSITLTIRNVGTGELSGLAATVSGPHTWNFIPGSFGDTVLAPGETTNLVVNFKPRQSGPYVAATLHISSNDPDGSFDLALAGNGSAIVSPVFQTPEDFPWQDGSLNASALTFGTLTIHFVPAAGMQLRVFNNTGGNPISGAITGLPEGGTVTTVYNGIEYSFTATYTGGDGNDIVLTATGPVLPPGWVLVDFEELQTANALLNEIGGSYEESGIWFGSPSVEGMGFHGTGSPGYPGDTALVNLGPQELTCRMVNHALFDLEEMIVSELPGGLAASVTLTGVKTDGSLVQALLTTDGGNLSPQVFTRLSHFAAFTGLSELRISGQNPGHQLNALAVSASEVGPEIAVESADGVSIPSGGGVSAGFVVPGQTSSFADLTIRNDGQEALSGLSVVLAGDNATEFSVDDSTLPGSLASGESATLRITFTPLNDGLKNARLEIASNDFNEFPFIVGLAAASGSDPVPPVISGFVLTPTSVNLTGSERWVDVELDIEDNFSGLLTGRIDVRDSSDNLVPQIGAGFGAAERISGDSLDGTYRVRLRVPEWTAAGNYHVEVTVTDLAGSSQTYGRSALSLPGPDEISVSGQVVIQSNVWVWDGGQSTAWENPGNWGWGNSYYTPPQSLDIHIGPINTYVGSLFFEDRVPASADVVLSSSFSTGNIIRMYPSNQSVRLSLAENASLTSYRIELGTLRSGETLSSHAATLDLAGGSSVMGTIYAGFGGRGVINVSGNATISSLLLGIGGAATLNVGPNGNLNTSSLAFGSGQVAVNNLGDWTQSGSWSGTINGFHNGSDASFTIASVVSFGQSIFNQGTLATLSSSGNYMDLNMVGPVTLSGGGEVILNSSLARIYGTGASQFLTNEDNMIRGQGYIYVPVVNQGVIRAEGGLLNLTHNTVFDNSLGRIEIAGNGELNLSGFLTASLGLGEMFIEAGGLISNGSALKDANLTGPGPLVVPVGTIEIAGTLSNPVAINYADQPGNHKYLEIEGPTFLTGGGELVLRDGLSHLIAGSGNLPDDHLTNVNNMIRGQGNINVPLVNQGVIRAEGGLLSITRNTVFDNSQGRVEIAANAELGLFAFLTASEGLGDLFIEPGGLVSSGSAMKDANLTGPGPLVVPVGVIEIAGTLSNPVAINYADQPGNHKYLEIEGPTFLTGGGELVMRDGLSHLIPGVGNLPDDHLTNMNNMIRGQGNINVPMANQGVIRAEGGLLSITRNTVFDNSQGRVEIAGNGELSLSGFLTGSFGLGELFIESGGSVSSGSALKDANLTGPGPLVVPVGVIEIAGTLSNPVAINYADQPGNHKYLEIEGPTFLTGGGELVMRDGLSHLTAGSGNLPDDHLTNLNNMIRGHGNINVPMVNQGVIRAEGGLLSITNNTVFNNSQGRVEIAGNGELSLSGFLTGSFGLGELFIESGGSVSSGSALKNANLTGPGPLVVPVGVIEIAGTLSNPVAINYADQPGNHKYLEIEGPTFLTGGGELVMRDGLSHLTAGSGNLPDDHLTNVNNMIRGQGNISVPLVNQGVIRAESGILIVSSSPFTNESGEIEVAPNATLRISTAGFSQGAGGKTVVSGLLDIDQNVTLGAGRIEGGGIIDAQSRTLSLGGAILAPGSGIGGISSRGTLNLNGTFEIELGGTVRGVDHDTLQHIGNVQLGGNLSVSVSSAFKELITASDSFTILTSGTTFTDFTTGAQIPGYSGSQGGITGTFANAALAGRVFTTDGTGSFLVTQTAMAIELSDYRAEDPFSSLTQANAMSDADLDGVPLLFEFLFGGDPAFAGPVYPAVSSGSLSGAALLALDPELSVDHAASYPVFEVLIRRDRQGIGFLPQASGDLSFTENPPFRAVQVGDTSPEGEFDRHRYIILPPSGDSPPTTGFLRLLFDYSSLPPI